METMTPEVYEKIHEQLPKVYCFKEAKTCFKTDSHEILKIGNILNYKSELEYLKPNFTTYSFEFLLIGDEVGYLEYVLQYFTEKH